MNRLRTIHSQHRAVLLGLMKALPNSIVRPFQAKCVAIMALALFLQACSSSDLRGNYDVELEIPGIARTLNGTLILSTGLLDIPSLTDEDRALFGDWFVSDTVDVNSCFILESPGGGEGSAKVVRVFEMSVKGDGITLPIEIYRTPTQHIEIVDLQFFLDAIGGDIILHDRQSQREGRLHGTRTGPPRLLDCEEELASFRENLRQQVVAP